MISVNLHSSVATVLVSIPPQQTTFFVLFFLNVCVLVYGVNSVSDGDRYLKKRKTLLVTTPQYRLLCIVICNFINIHKILTLSRQTSRLFYFKRCYELSRVWKDENVRILLRCKVHMAERAHVSSKTNSTHLSCFWYHSSWQWWAPVRFCSPGIPVF